MPAIVTKGPEQQTGQSEQQKQLQEKTPLTSLNRQILFKPKPNGEFVAAMAYTKGGGLHIVRAVTEEIVPGTDLGAMRKSELRYSTKLADGTLKIGEKVTTEDPEGVISKLTEKEEKATPSAEVTFLGLEDPDLYVDKKGRKYLFFTIAFGHQEANNDPTFTTYLGIAEKENETWIMKPPVLSSEGDSNPKEPTLLPGGKALYEEIATAPDGLQYSRIRIAEYNPDDIAEPWKPKRVIIDPYAADMPEWIQGFASTGPLIKDLGNGKMLCWVNGRGANTLDKEGKVHYSPFKVGMAVFDTNKQSLEWISQEPLVEDREAQDVTFVSDGDTNAKTVIVRGHVNDAFIAEYTMDKEELFSFVPEKFFAKGKPIDVFTK